MSADRPGARSLAARPSLAPNYIVLSILLVFALGPLHRALASTR